MATHLMPFPPTDGGRIGFFNPLKYLSRRNEVMLACWCAPAETVHVERLREYCEVVVFPSRTPGAGSRLRGLFSSVPGSAAAYVNKDFAALLRKSAKSFRPDLVELHHLNLAIYRNVFTDVPVVLREHNVEYTVWERHAEHATSLTERIYVGWNAPRVRSYEGKMAESFDLCVTVSEADRDHLKVISPKANVISVPSGVDTEFFFPRSDIREEQDLMVLTGSFGWKPKQHNLRRLVADVFPKIRAKVSNAKLLVVGKDVPNEIRDIASPGVAFTGMVDDVRPYIARASLILNYLESGGGIALKVLEAMAMKKAVLSNVLGCEGISVRDGVEASLADGVSDFAVRAAQLLSDATMRMRLAEAGFRLVVRKYSWDRVSEEFEAAYGSLVEGSSGPLSHAMAH